MVVRPCAREGLHPGIVIALAPAAIRWGRGDRDYSAPSTRCGNLTPIAARSATGAQPMAIEGRSEGVDEQAADRFALVDAVDRFGKQWRNRENMHVRQALLSRDRNGVGGHDLVEVGE